MPSLAKWMIWLLVSMIGAAVAVPIGFIIARIIYPPLFFVSYFLLALLSLVGLAIGLAPVGIVGGAVVGTIIGSLQYQFLKGNSRYKGWWINLGILGWTQIGIFTIGVVVPVEKGDLSPLVWLIVLGALMAGAAQWIGLRSHLRQAGRRVLISTLGALSGGLVGVALLGTMSSRGALDPFQRAMTFREFVYRAGATELTNLNGTLIFFVTAEGTYLNTWWELWTSDGSPGGTVPVRRSYTGWNQPRITLETQFKDMLFFNANGVLDKADAQSWKNRGGQWRTDGTSAGTIPLDSYFPDPIVLANNCPASVTSSLLKMPAPAPSSSTDDSLWT